MATLLRSWRRFYGENPLHLLVMLGCFALAGYVVSLVATDPSAIWLAIWFVGAVIGHDLVLYPLYALADQPLTVGRWARRKYLPRRPPLVPAINHVRAPFLGSAVLGLIYLPTIAGRGEDALRFTSGLSSAGVLDHWLLITAVLFLGSAVIYAGRLGTAVRRSRAQRARPPAAVGAPVGDGIGVGQSGPDGSGAPTERGADEDVDPARTAERPPSERGPSRDPEPGPAVVPEPSTPAAGTTGSEPDDGDERPLPERRIRHEDV